MNRLKMPWGVLRHHGPGWIFSRLLLEAQKRLGWEERIFRPRAWHDEEWRHWVIPELAATSAQAVWSAWRSSPGATWGDARRTDAWRAAYAQALTPKSRAAVIAAAEKILQGRFTLFSRHEVAAGFPPPWLANPALGPAATPDTDRHWSRLPMQGESYGDLKYVWELSRFAWAFTLARAFAATADERFAEGFWQLWESWIAANPPNQGPNWKCAQECALRLIAAGFAVQVLATSRATTSDRFVCTLGAVAALADRVARGGRYALLQDNNHSMSEAAGLYTTGVFFPVLRNAASWRKQGWSSLGAEALRLIRPEGTFIQKSHNYHRLMLHDYLWADSLARQAGDAFAADVAGRLRAAADYLRGILDPETGHVPNFGANDGALILPLETAAYDDFRPVTMAAHFQAHGRRLVLGQRCGEESLLWLFGAAALRAPTETGALAPLACARGGLFTLRQAASWAFIHAEHFCDRPGQADQLHLDLWWRGVNLARDAGTYLYYGPPELYAWFRGSCIHNTVTVDGQDQMQPGPRFLWASRAQACMLEQSVAGLVAEHDGYRRLPAPVDHRRGVVALGNDRWLVWDELTGSGEHQFRLHWLLPDVPWQPGADGDVLLTTPEGPFHVAVWAEDGATASPWRIERALEGMPAWGWESLHYGERTPALSLILEVSTKPPARFVTVFSPTPVRGAISPSGHLGAITWPGGGQDLSPTGPWSLATFPVSAGA
jgi:asparagine synthase (glutamine-hydrolysing)